MASPQKQQLFASLLVISAMSMLVNLCTQGGGKWCGGGTGEHRAHHHPMRHKMCIRVNRNILHSTVTTVQSLTRSLLLSALVTSAPVKWRHSIRTHHGDAGTPLQLQLGRSLQILSQETK